MKSKLLILAASTLTASAATVTFDTATVITNVSILDAPYSAGYAFVSAMNVGESTARTITTPGGATIPLAASNNLGNVDIPAAASTVSGFYNGGNQSGDTNLFPGDTGNAEFNAVLRGNTWHNNGSDDLRPLTLRLGGLTVGQTYAVYLFTADARSTDRSQAYWDGFSSPTFSGNSSVSFTQNSATVVKGTFTADAGYQDIFIQETDNLGNDDTHLSAYTLYAVPEPGTAMLAAAAGLLAFARRRR